MPQSIQPPNASPTSALGTKLAVGYAQIELAILDRFKLLTPRNSIPLHAKINKIFSTKKILQNSNS